MGDGGSATPMQDGSTIVGGWGYAVDLDSGESINISTAAPTWYLIKISAEGKYDWVKTLQPAGTTYDGDAHVGAVATGPDGSFFVAGLMTGTVDFDPGPGQDIKNGGNTVAVYLTKFDPSENYVWTRLYSPSVSADATFLTVLSDGSVLVGGSYTGTGPFGLPEMTGGLPPGFIARVGSDGNLNATSWMQAVENGTRFERIAGTDDVLQSGGPSFGRVNRRNGLNGATVWSYSVPPAFIASFGDANLSVIRGRFENPVDLDPGPDVDIHTGASGGNFFSGVDKSGQYLFSREMEATPSLVAFDDTTIFILGQFPDRSDLDPGPAIDLHNEGGTFATLAILRFAR
jgi:hypothetical protein